MPDLRSQEVLARTIAAYLRRAAEWLADYRDAAAEGRGTAANHLFYAGEAVVLAVLAAEGLNVARGEQHQFGVAIRRLPDESPHGRGAHGPPNPARLGASLQRGGLGGAVGLAGPGRSQAVLSPEQEAEVAEWVRQGPDLARDGVVRWRRADLARAIEAKFGVVLAERRQHQHRAAAAGLPALGAPPPAPRPRRGGAGVFRADFAPLVDAALPEHARGKPPDLWWQDDARIGQQGTLARVWARLAQGSVRRSRMKWQDEGERGSRPAAPRDQRRYA